MKLIKIFSDFCSSTDAKKNYENVCDINYQNYNWRLVDDDNYTHAIILNKAMPYLRIPKKNVIGLAFEPKQLLDIDNKFIEYAKNHIGRYLIGIENDLPDPFIEHYSYMWCNWKKNISNITFNEKPFIMSIIVSNKRYMEGHIYRHLLVQKILDSNMDIHIYGNGTYKYGNDRRLKGEFIDNAPPYENYKYSICIENSLSNDYISEKYTNSISYNSIPLLFGARNINKYFGDNCCYRLTGDIDIDFNLIGLIYNNPDKFEIDLSEARNELLNGNAYFPTFINNIFWR
jgi:hypothetical protein